MAPICSNIPYMKKLPGYRTIYGLLLICLIGISGVTLISTNFGLRTVLFAIKLAVPGKLTIGSNQGTLVDGAQLADISYLNEQYGFTVDLHALSFKLNPRSLLTARLALDEFAAAEAHLSFAEQATPTAYTDNFDPRKLNHFAKFTGQYTLAPTGWRLVIEELTGTWQDQPLTVQLTAKLEAGFINIETANITLANNYLRLTKQQAEVDLANKLQWQININALEQIYPPLKGQIKGDGIIEFHAQPTALLNLQQLSGQLSAVNLAYKDFELAKFNAKIAYNATPTAPLKITTTASNLQHNSHLLKEIIINVSGTTSKQQVTANIDGAAAASGKIVANGELNNSNWHGEIENVTIESTYINNWQLLQPTKLEFNLSHFELAPLVLIKLDTKAQLTLQANYSAADLNIAGKLIVANGDYLQGKLQLSDLTDKQLLSGKVTTKLRDIAWIMQFMPDITRLKGKISGTINIDGSLQQPIISGAVALNKGSLRIPALGIKLKPLTLKLTTDNAQLFKLTGNTIMRDGPGEIKVSGYFEPFKPDIPNQFTITSTGTEFVNTQTAQLIADTDLKLAFKPNTNTLLVAGEVKIISGSINFDHNNSATLTHSRDVIFKDNQSKRHNKFNLTVVPDIKLRIGKQVKFKGFGLDAEISGKLALTRPEQHLLGKGRISLKTGTYKLPGQTLYINHGRLIYPPGTILSNPNLDIMLLSSKPSSEQNLPVATQTQQPQIGVYVHGSASKPLFQNSGLIDDKQALPQILNATGSPVINKLQNTLALEQIGIESANGADDNVSQDTQAPSLLDNKNLVVGKKLSDRVYVQYMKSLMDANNAVRLKYGLGKYWAIGVESGTFGNGADLSFTINKN